MATSVARKWRQLAPWQLVPKPEAKEHKMREWRWWVARMHPPLLGCTSIHGRDAGTDADGARGAADPDFYAIRMKFRFERFEI